MASTSSVYGSNSELPNNENQKTDTPMSFYAATKKSNEVMAHSILICLIFLLLCFVFLLYMVHGVGQIWLCLSLPKNILSDLPINIYNNGDMKRDFTYVLDLVKAVYLLIKKFHGKCG